jgi:hypothetical protein
VRNANFSHTLSGSCLPKQPIWGDNARNLFI